MKLGTNIKMQKNENKKKLTTGKASELQKWRDTFTNNENENEFPFYVRFGDSCLCTIDPAAVS